MSETLNPVAANQHLPAFVTAPGQSDWLMNVVMVLLVLIVLVVGILYLRLHALPERMAHRTNLVQFEFVAVLALIALFTHNNLFWVAALLLALIRIPDISGPLTTIADSVTRLAGGPPSTSPNDPDPPPAAAAGQQVDPAREPSSAANVASPAPKV